MPPKLDTTLLPAPPPTPTAGAFAAWFNGLAAFCRRPHHGQALDAVARDLEAMGERLAALAPDSLLPEDAAVREGLGKAEALSLWSCINDLRRFHEELQVELEVGSHPPKVEEALRRTTDLCGEAVDLGAEIFNRLREERHDGLQTLKARFESLLGALQKTAEPGTLGWT